MPFTASVSTILGILGIALSIPAWLFFARAVYRIFRLISAGQPSPNRTNRPFTRLKTMVTEVLFHTELMRKPAVAVAHWFVMMGFALGAIVWFEAYIQTFNPAGGWPVLSRLRGYHFVEEVLAVGTIVGICFLFAVRFSTHYRRKLSRFYGSNVRAALFVESVILLEGLGMLAVKAGKIATFGDGSPWVDFLSIHIAKLLPASPELISVFALIKLLIGMVWLVVVARNLNWGVAWHRFLAFFNIFFRREPDGGKALGKLPPLVSHGEVVTLESLEESEEEPQLGVGTLADAPWKMLLDVASCTECGRCQEQCPAWHTDKPLSPKLLVQDLRDAAVEKPAYLADVDVLKLVGEGLTISPDVLWSCTNCGACVEQCPVDIEHIDHVANLRRYQVLAESEFPSELTSLFKNLEVKGNPWGRNKIERRSWVDEARRDGIDVPILGTDVTDFEYLFWVGCAGAFDDAAKRTTRAVVELLHTAGVNFAVLAHNETCTGDPARRAGNEFLFQQLALENIATLNGAFDGYPKGQRKIITTCPHCLNTLRNEYPDFDGHYDVFHHTQLLNRLVQEKLLTPIPRSPENRKPITYHDPCFLGRHNKIFDPPRELIEATGANLTEMPRNKNEGFCCGAGGARMFMEEKLGTRINENRAAEATATGAAEVAVGCPFCNTMLTTGLKTVSDTAPQVKDVAQMLRDAILIDGALPTPQPKKPISITRPPKKPTPPQPAGSTHTNAAPKPAASDVSTPKPPTIPAPVAPPGGATPGVAKPPAATPPTAVPPAAIPPAATPPTPAPPAGAPPVTAPPTPTPPAATPPAAAPPVAGPPVATPPTAAPPAATPPAAAPPVAGPPAATPPTPMPPGRSPEESD
ncbi:MAG: heterodisulfide reductase-related iron-sulfur binding cluster [Corynebacterium sp.]|uniref:heterodisulfide reductase-related iron-sulfur binding cluster n=1 Tax=Corynebacterium sp. TaxID=1720 RepID=UPI0026DCF257|nr:heterodisulfide reductase-related iron-sulfur binding cluster [Corynebacterium sp.]MDO5097502.1 heterodisulfide reductase-related iron-sulfur binding cluster [Corynebacterium sp.]